MSIPTNMTLTELVARTQSLTDTYYDIFTTCESVDEIASLNNWYWSAMHTLWMQHMELDSAA